MRRLLLTIILFAAAAISVTAQGGVTPTAVSPSQTGAPAVAPGAAAPTPPAAEVPGYAYNPDGRRDPFLSLLRRGLDMKGASGGRAPGLAGLLVSEVVLKGIVASQGGFVAIVQGVDNRNYTVRPGDKLLDGAVRGISQDTMVLLQHVNDPLSLEKQREVRKQLRQTEEAK